MTYLDEIELKADEQCIGLRLTPYRMGVENATDRVMLNPYRPGTAAWSEYEAGFYATLRPVCCDWPVGVEVAA